MIEEVCSTENRSTFMATIFTRVFATIAIVVITAATTNATAAAAATSATIVLF